MTQAARPQVMGILNVTPDSFSDGGRFQDTNHALQHALGMIADGADIIDIGGESTRPGADRVSLEEELERTIPVIQAIREHSDIPISIDTSKAEVMRTAVEAGASMINDVTALSAQGSLQAAAALRVPVCLMHMQGTPGTMQQSPEYPNGVVRETKQYLGERLDAAVAAGIDRQQLIIDPGFGFGKTLQHNYELLASLSQFRELGSRLLVGISRKSMIGNLLGVGPEAEERLAGSLAAAVIAAQNGADILRVHDVRETVHAVSVLQATRQAGSGQQVESFSE